MKKFTWKRFVISLAVLSALCLLCVITDNVYFFFVGLAAFFIILIAPFIG